MLRPVRSDRRTVGRSRGARLHRDAAARGRGGTLPACLAGWCGSAERRTSAAHGCAGGSPAARASPIRSIRALRARRPGRRSCSAPAAIRPAAGASRMRADSFHLVAAPGDGALGEVERLPPDAPVVLTVEGTHGPIIHAVTEAAAERGARAGARLTDARALDPALVAVPADPAGDAALVERLARWAGRWSPLVEVDGGDALRLDVTGVAHLFGGERGLVADVQERFAVAGLSTRVAIAPTAAAAWALGALRQGARDHLRQGHRREARRPSGRGAAAAARKRPARSNGSGSRPSERSPGIERRSLARRFREADNPVDALDRALGRKPEPLTAVPAERPPRALLKLEEPATHPEARGSGAGAADPRPRPAVAAPASRRAAAGADRFPGRRQHGGRHRSRRRFPAASRSISSACSPTRRRRSIPGFGFDAFALEASWAKASARAQDSLVGSRRGHARSRGWSTG